MPRENRSFRENTELRKWRHDYVRLSEAVSLSIKLEMGGTLQRGRKASQDLKAQWVGGSSAQDYCFYYQQQQGETPNLKNGEGNNHKSQAHI